MAVAKPLGLVRSRYITLLVFALITTVYLALPTQIHQFDPVVYSHYLRFALVKGDLATTLHPHHILYMPVAYGSYRLLNSLFGYTLLEYLHLQFVSLVFSLIGLLAAYKILKQLTEHAGLQWSGLLLLAFGQAFWLFSIDAEVHVPGLACAAWGIYWLGFCKKNSISRLGAAIGLALAAGFHLTNGTLLLSALLWLWLDRTRFKQIFVFGCGYGVTLFLCYLPLLWHGGFNPLQVFRQQLFADNHFTGYRSSYWQPFSWATLRRFFNSLRSALVGGEGVWSLRLGWLVLFIVLALALLAIFSSRRNSAQRPFVMLLLFWLLPQALFFLFWDTTKIEFKLHIIWPLVLLLIMALGSWRQEQIAIGMAFQLALCVGLVNGLLVFRPLAQQIDEPMEIARRIEKSTVTSGWVVITGKYSGYGLGKIYIPYFGHRQVVILDWQLGKKKSLADLASFFRREAAANHPVYLLAETVESGPALNELLATHYISQSAYNEFLVKLRLQALHHIKGLGMLYQINP